MGLLRAFIETEINILQQRKKESLTPDMKDVIDILTLDPNNPPKIVGSFKYKVHEYPADIDLYEGVQGCCTIDTTKYRMVQYFKNMALKIQNRRFTYLGDFKAGIDERYYINVGEYNPEEKKIINYNKDDIINQISRLYETKLLSKDDAVRLIRLVYDRPNYIQYQELRDAIRNHYVLRWSIKELLSGYKILPLRKKITLSSAISQGTIVKADLWALIDDRFMEVTNWFMLTAIENDKTIYLSEKPDLYQKSLKNEIMLLKNPELKKNMKLAKRMWLYAISQEDHYTIKQLYPLFSSPVAKLYQIQSEIEILINMVEKLQDPPYSLISKQISQFKTRIGSIPDIYLNEKNEEDVLKNLDLAFKAYKEKNRDLIVKNLSATYDLLKGIIDAKAKEYLRKNIPKNKLIKTILQTAKKRARSK